MTINFKKITNCQLTFCLFSCLHFFRFSPKKIFLTTTTKSLTKKLQKAFKLKKFREEKEKSSSNF